MSTVNVADTTTTTTTPANKQAFAGEERGEPRDVSKQAFAGEEYKVRGYVRTHRVRGLGGGEALDRRVLVGPRARRRL